MIFTWEWNGKIQLKTNNSGRNYFTSAVLVIGIRIRFILLSRTRKEPIFDLYRKLSSTNKNIACLQNMLILSIFIFTIFNLSFYFQVGLELNKFGSSTQWFSKRKGKILTWVAAPACCSHQNCTFVLGKINNSGQLIDERVYPPGSSSYRARIVREGNATCRRCLLFLFKLCPKLEFWDTSWDVDDLSRLQS